MSDGTTSRRSSAAQGRVSKRNSVSFDAELTIIPPIKNHPELLINGEVVAAAESWYDSGESVIQEPKGRRRQYAHDPVNDILEEEQLSPPAGVPDEQPSKKRGSRWSISYLRTYCQAVLIEDLYKRYWVKSQRLLLFKLVLIMITHHIFSIIFYNSLQRKSQTYDRSQSLRINISFACSTFLHIICGGLVFFNAIYTRIHLGLGIAVWILSNIILFVHIPFMERLTVMPMDNVPAVFYIIFITHTMLSTSCRISLVLGILTGLTDLIVVGILSEPTISLKIKIMQLVSNALIYGCANVTGLYHKHLTDIMHRHTFIDTRTFLETDIRYSREREKQNCMRENLLLKVIPKHLIQEMKDALKEKFQAPEEVRKISLQRSLTVHSDAQTDSIRLSIDGSPPKQRKTSHSNNPSSKMFQDLLVERHDNVSILYADIVNFTPLTHELEPSDLVRALNELFGRFDELARKNNCLRIKMLGDCYYCVSGLPEFIPDHARNCVIMGMQMIKVIRLIRVESGVEKLDMRIGIHSGYVLSGVLGLKKWQYDIWSDDVTIANHMESGGLPGKVHITKETLAKLDGKFSVEPGEGSTRDDFLKDKQIRTFFIKEEELQKVEDTGLLRHGSSSLHHLTNSTRHLLNKRRFSVCLESFGAEVPFDSLSDFMLETGLPEAAEVNKRLERVFHLEELRHDDHVSSTQSLRKRIRSSASELFSCGFTKSEPEQEDHDEEATSDVPKTRQTLKRRQQQLNPFTLRFKDRKLEHLYLYKRDSTYKFFVSCSFFIFLVMSVVQLLTLVRTIRLYVMLSLGFVLYIIILVFITGLKGAGCGLKVQGGSLGWLSGISDLLITNNFWKNLIFSVLTAVLFLNSILPVFECLTHIDISNETSLNTSMADPNTYAAYMNDQLLSATNKPNTNFTEEFDKNVECALAPYYMFCCMCSLVACSVFLRLSHLVKFTFMLIGIIIFNVMFYQAFESVFDHYDDIMNEPVLLPSSIRGSINTSVLFVTLIVLDRQIEKNLRLDFLCKVKMKQEKEEVRRNELSNELLLANILPKHVAEHFMRGIRPRNELYHQQCKNTCVMFAAIPNIKIFFSSIDVTGNECLRLLNEIISAFDMALISNRFRGVEKIKTIGSTYMAASGLDSVEDHEEDADVASKNVLLMVEFAWSLISALDEISSHAFYPYHLRIGMNHGPLVAGVVGAQKPQYDIWGDTVNVASRMESHGVDGKIQVPESTARLLIQEGVHCEHRGNFNVKGKGPMELYLIKEQRILSQLSMDSTDPANVIFN